MVERVLTDDPLRARLIAQATEHVLGFDWSDIAVTTAELYSASVIDRV
jgi:glycogen(starch) synthase